MLNDKEATNDRSEEKLCFKVLYKTGSDEKNQDVMEIRVYPGTDWGFNLYEDEQTNCNYEHVVYSTIPFKRDEQNQTLIIGKRKGEFEGMLNKRIFNIVQANKKRGNEIRIENNPVQVKYRGKKNDIKKE